jgi:hypothetical protein
MKGHEKEKSFGQNEIIQRIEQLGFRIEARADLGNRVYSLNNEIVVDLNYATLSTRRREYIFRLDKHRLDFFYEHHRHFFQLFICESDKRVFLLPLSLIMEIFHDIYAAGNDFKNFKPTIKLRNGVWFLRFFGQYDITDYLNRYDFLISESKTYRVVPTRFNSVIEIKTLEERFHDLAQEGHLRGDSLHIATVDMLRQIGEWSGFQVITEGVPQGMSDFPYQIDVLWYKGGDLYLAIEVCHHGVVEKDKDALKLARQHGARKVVIVSEINKMERIRKLFQYEGDIKSWAEVWSFERVFSMYESGLRFFRDFDKFRRYGWREGLSEFI